MTIKTRIERIDRSLASGEIDVVFVITNDGEAPRTARINGEEFPRQEGESLQDLTERALQQYRLLHKPTSDFSVLIMDCRQQPLFPTTG